MSAPQFLEISVVLIGFAIVLLDAFCTGIPKRFLAFAAIAGLCAILLATFFTTTVAIDNNAVGFWSFYAFDPLSLIFKRIALVTTIIILVMIVDYAPVAAIGIGGTSSEAGLGEFYSLPIFACAGMMWMASAIDFVMIFVSLELVTISFYVLVSLTRRNSLSLEAGVKYLVLSALSTGLLVYGITWVFGATGETNLQRVAQSLSASGDHTAALFGTVLIIIALAFKIAAAPFQLWVPDVYQGAPTPVTAFLSVGSKAAGLVVLLRVAAPFLALPQTENLLVGIAVLTLLYGNLAAIPQTNVKRLLAYSSIAHTGYILVAVVSLSGRAAVFYVVAYLLMTLLSFHVLILVAHKGGEDLEDFAGLARRSPFLAFAMLIAVASLAGVPFTAGFMGKFQVFDAAIAHRHFGLAILGVLTVACGFYYYFKIVRAMYWEPPRVERTIIIPVWTRAVMLLMIAGTFWLGVAPQRILAPLSSRVVRAVSVVP